MIRTHDAGALRAGDVGQTVTLAGWVARRRDHGGVAFIDLREASGVVQVVIRDEAVAHSLRSEYCLKVTGEVGLRPEGNANPNLPSGEIEVVATDVEVLSAAAAASVPDRRLTCDVGEEARLKHRYLDLRRTGPAAALRLRSKVNKAARDVLDRHDFVEIETPTLTRSTPEGARDFLVPARLKPGSWYALPQSPQLFKQLLMVAGMERYFQIARCYRDEDFRADRQPEFTQLDIEMSFVEQDDVLAVAEDVLVALWKLIGHDVPVPLPRMTYAEAMARFGSDKPDLRMGQELVECTGFFQDTPFRVFQAPYVGAVVMPGGASQPRKQLDAWQEWAKQRGARGLAYLLVKEDGELTGPVAKNISDEEKAGIAAHVGAEPGDCIFFAAGDVKTSRALLGAARLEIGRRGGLIDEDAWSFLWVVDAPLFEPTADATASGDVALGYSAWTAVHHAFTSPQDVDGLRRRPRQRAGLGLRHRLQRQRDRRRVDPYPPRGHPEAGLRDHGHRRGRGAGEVRVPARRLQVRRPAARRHRVRLGPDRRAADPQRLDPRGHRVPEERGRLRPAHRRPGADQRRSAQGSRCGRPSAEGSPAGHLTGPVKLPGCLRAPRQYAESARKVFL